MHDGLGSRHGWRDACTSVLGPLASGSTSMTTDPDPLTLPVARGVRIVALDRLKAAHGPADTLASKPEDLKALHDFRVAIRRVRSWIRAFKPELDHDLRGKDRHRLRELADRTNRGRDADVQIEWLQKASRNGNGSRKRGAERLIDQIRIEQHAAGPPLADSSLALFEKERSRLTKHLSTVREPVRPPATPPATLAAALAALLPGHLESLGQCLRALHSAGDEAEAHAARIAAKRLRYLLEPAAHVRGGKSLITQLKKLQDGLGALHDSHVLGHRIQTAFTDFEGPDQDALRAVEEHLAGERLALFHRIERRWLADDAALAMFSHKVGLVGARLEHLGADGDGSCR